MLFPGLMLTAKGPKVLEFNARWGDPETQVLVRRLDSDLLPLLEATCDGTLADQQPTWRDEAAVCVILASGGYPETIKKGLPIAGLERAAEAESVQIFHAGTRKENDATLTNGGRVLGVTALGADLDEARSRAYAAADQISFEGLHRRNDIGILRS
jgi:phosphoribosylamine--glycine ligase